LAGSGPSILPFNLSYSGNPPWIAEPILAGLRGKELVREGDEWKYTFEWDALQPQRARLVEPITYFQVSETCKAEFTAKVYADNFANPVSLRADISVSVERKQLQTETVIAEARARMEAEKRTSSSMSSSSMPLPSISPPSSLFAPSKAKNTGDGTTEH
jgi:hypothetical protein